LQRFRRRWADPGSESYGFQASKRVKSPGECFNELDTEGSLRRGSAGSVKIAQKSSPEGA